MTQPTSLADGRYLLVKQLGEGGMATVYRAFDQRLQVWRAVKILSPEFADKVKIARRFEAEAQTMALLEHRHIVRVYDVGRDGTDIAYIVMELVEGGCLVDWLELNGPMPPRMAVSAVMEVCDGLQHAHDKGIIHRDIKPHNVMVTLDGVCRVTDFGIARVGDSENSQTKTGSVMGTWGYMAPEQRTDAKNVDARADVYAVGATLYSLLTDRMPMDLFAAERNASILDGVHEAIVPLLVRSTEYDREDRYESVAAFRDALAGILDELPAIGADVEPLALRPPPPLERPDPSVFRPATEAAVIKRTSSVSAEHDVTAYPDEIQAPTLLPDGDDTQVLATPAPAPSRPHHLTLPPEEVAVTEPGAVTRQTRPVYDPTPSPGGLGPAATGASIPERAAAPVAPVPDRRGGIAVLLGLAALGVALLTLAVVVFVALDRQRPEPVPEPVQQAVPTVPDPAPPTPGPAPVAPQPAPVVPQPAPVAPQPAPVAPQPAPVAPQPAPVAPQPAPVVPQPVPVAPQPVEPAPEPVAPEPVAPEPKGLDCVSASASLNSTGTKVVFRATPCDGAPTDYPNEVVVHYRVPGKGWVQHALNPFGRNWTWGLPVTDVHRAAGIEYYVDGWTGSFGSASAPKRLAIP